MVIIVSTLPRGIQHNTTLSLEAQQYQLRDNVLGEDRDKSILCIMDQ